MPSKVCPNCGHKNKASESICTQCGNFLDDVKPASPMPADAPVQQPKEATPDNVPEPDEVRTTRSVGKTITIRSGSEFYRYVPIIFSAVILVIYIVLDIFVIQSIYLFFVFLLLIFVIPSLARNWFSPVKMFTGGFRVPSDGNYESFYFREIDSAEVVNPTPGVQMVTLSLNQGEQQVTLDFEKIYPLRMLLTQLNRRKIPINVKRGENQQTA